MIQKIEIYCDENPWKAVIRGKSELHPICLGREDQLLIGTILARNLTEEDRQTPEGKQLVRYADNLCGAPGSPYIPQYENHPLPGGIEGSREATMGQPAPEAHAV